MATLNVLESSDVERAALMREAIAIARGHFGDEEPDQFAILVALAAMLQCTNPAKLSLLSGYDSQLLDTIASRMRASGIWTENSVDHSEWRETAWNVGFCMHVLVAKGRLARTGERRNGQAIYVITEEGRRVIAAGDPTTKQPPTTRR